MYGFTGGNAPRDAAIHAPYAQPPQRAEGRPSSVRGGHARIARARYGAPLPLVLVSPALLAPAVDTLARDHFEPSMSTLAGGDTVECREAAILDLDGDGYAEYFAHGSDRDEVSTTDELPLTCPAGWVKARGDCDDNDPLVTPRRQELFGNRTEDNCDGWVDEPTFL